MPSPVTMKALLETGVHFGHRTTKWNPKMKPYIFTERNGIHIIDLQQTIANLNHYYDMVRDMVSRRRDGAVRRHETSGAGSHCPRSRTLRRCPTSTSAGSAAR